MISELDFESDIKDMLETQRANLKTHASYLGKDVDDVLRSLGQCPPSERERTALDALSQAHINTLDAARAPAAQSTTAYTGSANLSGFIRGSCDANVYFGSAGNYSFSGSMWTSPITAAGGGVGAWSMIPSNGQDMDFTWVGGALSGGAVNVLWNIGGSVVGSMAIVVAGIGGGGGHGSGTWTKG